jgi:hypothetical protein
MLPGDALGVPAVGRTTPASAAAALGDPRQQALQRALAPYLGKSMQGEVLARLADGSAVVRVADATARMPLPGTAQAGAQVPLTLLALHPRPTFQVGTPGQPALAYVEAGPELAEGADPHAAPLALREGASVAAARTALSARLPFGAGGAGAADLSPAGRALGSVLGAALKNEHPASAVAGATPVLGAPGADPGALATALARTVETSGLFYESHVAEWAGGARSLADLAAEPQQAAASAGRPPDAADPATAGFINLQLVAHEQDHIAWQGQLWPGQPLRLEIDKDAPEGQAGGDNGGAAWQSRLRLRFPQLGELDATLALAGGRLQLRVAAGSNAARDLLRAHQGQLVDAMAAAGTPLAAFAIQVAPGADE